MRLTQEYINRKKLEWERSPYVDEYKARALVDNLQIRLEMQRVDEELRTGETEEPTTPTSGNTCASAERPDG